MLCIGNQQDLSNNLEGNPFLNTAMQRFTCNLYYRFGALLAPVSVRIITGKHYAKSSITKLNDRSDNGNCEPATRNCNKTKEPSESSICSSRSTLMAIVSSKIVLFSSRIDCSDGRIDCTLCQQFRFVQKSIV